MTFYPMISILIAEDDRRIQVLLQTILRREGFAVESVEDGGEALQRCSNPVVPYDVILLDFAMPNASGADVIEQLTAAKRTDVLAKIIVITAASARDAASFQGIPVLRKPFDNTELIAMIRRTAARTSSASVLPPPVAESRPEI